MIRVLVSANSAIELAGLTSLIKSAHSLELAGSTLSGVGLAEQIEMTRPDVVLQQSAAADEETSEWPATGGAGQDFDAPVRVLLVDESEFVAALGVLARADSAVRAVLPRWATGEEIVAAVAAAATGLQVLHPAVVEHGGGGTIPLKPDSRALSATATQALSPRESEILNMLADGLGNKEIAWRLHISEHTVKFHIGSIFNKLNASSRAEAVAIGIRRGLIAL
jgi:two-component system, NarL family, response regulator YdfI